MQQSLRSQERGTVLIMGLMTLVLLTALGIAAVTSSVMENDITANERTYKEAFYAAEMALTVGENVMRGLLTIHDLDVGNVPGHYDKGEQPYWQDLHWDNTDSQVIPAYTSVVQHPATDLRYVIEERDVDLDSSGIGMGIPTGVNLFNISARGIGGHIDAKVVVRSIYAKRFS